MPGQQGSRGRPPNPCRSRPSFTTMTGTARATVEVTWQNSPGGIGGAAPHGERRAMNVSWHRVASHRRERPREGASRGLRRGGSDLGRGATHPSSGAGSEERPREAVRKGGSRGRFRKAAPGGGSGRRISGAARGGSGRAAQELRGSDVDAAVQRLTYPQASEIGRRSCGTSSGCGRGRPGCTLPVRILSFQSPMPLTNPPCSWSP
jgi:hypothetical protein